MWGLVTCQPPHFVSGNRRFLPAATGRSGGPFRAPDHPHAPPTSPTPDHAPTTATLQTGHTRGTRSTHSATPTTHAPHTVPTPIRRAGRGSGILRRECRPRPSSRPGRGQGANWCGWPGEGEQHGQQGHPACQAAGAAAATRRRAARSGHRGVSVRVPADARARHLSRLPRAPRPLTGRPARDAGPRAASERPHARHRPQLDGPLEAAPSDAVRRAGGRRGPARDRVGAHLSAHPACLRELAGAAATALLSRVAAALPEAPERGSTAAQARQHRCPAAHARRHRSGDRGRSAHPGPAPDARGWRAPRERIGLAHHRRRLVTGRGAAGAARASCAAPV